MTNPKAKLAVQLSGSMPATATGITGRMTNGKSSLFRVIGMPRASGKTTAIAEWAKLDPNSRVVVCTYADKVAMMRFHHVPKEQIITAEAVKHGALNGFDGPLGVDDWDRFPYPWTYLRMPDVLTYTIALTGLIKCDCETCNPPPLPVNWKDLLVDEDDDDGA